MLNVSFTAPLIASTDVGGWDYVIWPECAAFFETRKLVRISGLVEGVEFQSTFLPVGQGVHILPIRGAILKTIKKRVGDEVTVELRQRI